MRNWIKRKSICFVFAVAVTMAFANQAKAGSLNRPILDFGFTVNWDGTNLTDGSISIVFGGFYVDGSTFTSGDAVTGQHVDFDFSFDGIDTNDKFDIDGFFTGKIVDLDDSIDPTLGFSANLGSVTPTSPPASQWWDEFSAVFPPVNSFYGRVIFTPMAHVGGTVYNATGKLTPTPEPGTMALLGIGLAGLACAWMRKHRKRKSATTKASCNVQ